MAGKEKPQILDLRRTKMLAAMGVQVWHLRPTAGEAEVSVLEPSVAVKSTAPRRVAADLESTPVRASQAPQREPELPEQPPEVPVAKPPPVPLEFFWAKGSASMLLLRPVASATSMIHAKDILRYADWRVQRNASGPIKNGEFKWPQLLDTTTGTPARSLGVFIEKHFPGECPWFLLADDLVDDLLPWLRECLPDGTNEKILVLQSFSESVTDASLKKQIWQILQQIR